jgi:hypothetical protein
LARLKHIPKVTVLVLSVILVSSVEVSAAFALSAHLKLANIASTRAYLRAAHAHELAIKGARMSGRSRSPQVTA